MTIFVKLTQLKICKIIVEVFKLISFFLLIVRAEFRPVGWGSSGGSNPLPPLLSVKLVEYVEWYNV